MNAEKEIKEFENLLKLKNEDYYNKYFKQKNNIDKIMKQVLKNFFLDFGQLLIRINFICDCLEKYKENSNDKNKLDSYIEKMNKLYAIFCLAMDTFEEITTEIIKR